MHSSKTKTGSPANGGQSNNNTDVQNTVRLIPSARVVALRRKMQGADKRIATRERDLEVLHAKLDSKILKLTLAERRDVRRSILDVEFELEQARDQYRVYARSLRSALHNNNKIAGRRLADHRAMRRLMSRVPSFTADVRASVHTEMWVAATGSGSADPIQTIVLGSDWDKFEKVLGDLLQEHKPALWSSISRFEPVKMAVLRNIWREYERKDIVVGVGDESSLQSEEVIS
ncbi:MAG: hypothetical protein NTU47_04150 [Ignavibacteriales bacterium]|nr:hypothetical protein [Ignavibacteriales bacterium]